ncbi:putative sugar transferase EpsL [termite gut metagenome]|uniref:Putative sugar transferase EpsL n=1 Tax=termite gut metagenome TaxID=433724 RepID=A0A5J4SIL8_9ZZZZ
MIRFFDIIFSFFGLLVLSPVFFIIALCIALDSKGGVFYKQVRVGKNNVEFELYKFRTMTAGSDKGSLITIGVNDSRITKMGYFLRKYKLDELPQLINVLRGDMSFVGPRPEVRKYVDLYDNEQQRVLSVAPGITDYASIEYMDENSLLGNISDPDKAYIEQVMPEKLQYNMRYINNYTTKEYFKIIFLTVWKIIHCTH